MDSPTSTQHNGDSRFELQTILETSRLLAESHDMDFVLNNLLLISMGKLMVSRGLVLLFDPLGDEYIVSKSKGRKSLPEGEILKFDELDKIQKRSVIACDSSQLPVPQLIEGDTSCTLFNLQTRDSHIGFLCLGSKGDCSALRKHEIEFVESLTIISSVAIANSRMFTELKHTNRRLDRTIYELNTLLELSKDFNRMVDRREIIQVFKFAMLGQMLIRKFFFVLKQDGQRSLVGTNSTKGTLSGKQMESLFSLGEDIVMVESEVKQKIPFLKNNDIRALISLYFQDEKLAVVGIGGKANGEPYREADFNFLQSLGNLALLSIEKTLLLEERIEKERLEEELVIARNIQQGLLPNPIPAHPMLDIAARNVPTRQVGGDYFDILRTPDENLLLAIGDVTGKGTPAALLMANLQAMLHVLVPIEISLKDATARINTMIYQNTPSNKFVTFFWGLFNPRSREFRYVNAGHNPPLLFRRNETTCIKLEAGGLILGAMSTATTYDEDTVQLNSGDVLVFYTDGVTEALNEDNTEEYGEERLINCIRENKAASSDKLMQTIIMQIKAFSADIQYDDITLIVVKVN